MEPKERPQHNGLPLYRIPEYNLDALKARVAKMNKRASKLGMEPIVVSEIGEEFDLYYRRLLTDQEEWVLAKLQDGESNEQAQERLTATLKWPTRFSLRRLVTLTVTGSLPRVNGWAMAATIQHDQAGNLLMTVPGFETTLPLQYRTAPTLCDHCHTNRVRKDTYVLQHEDGSWKQVGRNCLADFIRSGNANAWAEAAEFLAGLSGEIAGFEDEGGESSGRGTIYFRAIDLLAQVACVVREDGWCSRTEAKNAFGKVATVDFALCLFDSKFVAKLSAVDQERFTAKDDDATRAEKAIQWAQELPGDVSNDYLWNILVVSHRENLSHREAGLAGSIIAAYLRHLEAEVKRAYERETTLDEHFGTVGKRDVFTLTVTGQRDMESDYGSLTLYKFRDADGRTAALFSSASIVRTVDGETTYGLNIGETVTVKASVKKHDVYNGLKQTMLTRLALYDAEAEAAAKKAAKAAKKLAKAEDAPMSLRTVAKLAGCA